jgi:Peptidase family M28
VKTKNVRLLISALLLALLTLSAVSADRLKAHVAWLADPAREGRYAGTPGGAAAADYIARQLREIGCDVQMQDFGSRRRNVVGRIGTAPRYVLVGAHYDGQGPGMPSASDNAAGVAVTIEILRELRSKELPVSLVAVAFDDEEQGLNGSRYYSDHPIHPLENAQAAIIFDTMGRQFMDLSTWTMFVLGAEYSKELAGVIQKRSRPDLLVVGTDLIGPRSDFAPFAVKHVPYLFFTHATHKDYHGPGDTVDRVNFTRLAQDANFIAQIAEDIARLQAQPKYLAQPVYPAGEAAALQKELELVETERKDLPQAYQLMFTDFKTRLKSDNSREVRRIATSVLLALATPRLSPFMLNFFIGPYYERENRRDLAAAAYEEALKWTSDAAERRDLEEKIKALR